MCGFISFLVSCAYDFLRSKIIRRDEENQTVDAGSTEITFESCSPRPFTFEELSRATNDFHEDRIIGRGGFSTVYRAILPDGITVAVKRVSSISQQGIKEYKAEVMIVSRSNHRNLVQIIGWCHERQGELLIVYEILENKSLEVHLFNSEIPPLAWDVRYRIAQGLAKALRYLHEECALRCVLHMDIKPSNVLLDSKFEPKLCDFGLAKLIDCDRSIMELSVIAGTRGYVAPECVLTGKVGTHSDVYSYGVMALELATGRKTIDPSAEEDQKVLVKWVQNLYKAGRVMEAVDPKLGDDYNELQVKGLLIIGLWCVLHDFRERPSMREIVRILNNTEDPLLDLHGKIPSLIRDPVHFDFDSICETSFGSSDSIISMELENPIPVDPMVLSSGVSEDEDQAYRPLFMWQHISLLNLWRYLIGVMWFRSSHNG
ncbi:clade XVII lectin receptor kinase [Artemisia annua]|uniref:Clade XVII lectin receptor kinase n=1 Tax=Artemisia annua TaxID=35608 RepID=A0A2U1LMN2_ARTAN|nr:clade XVII lectin receptor kinase [Artemisia annua]